ncbi:hypothetical protein D3C71_1656920 [compost metagenome]
MVAHRAAAGLGRRDQLLDGQRALRVTHQPQILANQFGLARVHQVAALEVIEEEVAVRAVVEPRQRLHGGAAGVGIVAAGVDHRRDGALRQFHIVAQLHFLALEVGRLHQRALVAGQRGGLIAHGQGDAEHGHRQRRHGEQQDLLTEFHLDRG